MLDNESKMSAGEEKKEFVPGPAWRAAEAMGIDMSLIELALTKTVWERWEDHDRALSEACMLREAVEEQYGKSTKDSS
jgi:hypothetical protein